MNIKEIVEKEKCRESISDARVIHLYLEGSFYRAYEWSAWLCVSRINKFKASNRVYNDIDGSVALIGFPPTSLAKFTPEGADVISVSEKVVDVVLPEQMIPEGYDIRLMYEDFAEWKRNLPVAEKQRERKNLPQKEEKQAYRVTDIMQKILAFNVNRKSPFECMEFISEVREQLIAIL